MSHDLAGAHVRSVLTLEDRTAWERHKGLTVQGDREACDKMGAEGTARTISSQ